MTNPAHASHAGSSGHTCIPLTHPPAASFSALYAPDASHEQRDCRVGTDDETRPSQSRRLHVLHTVTSGCQGVGLLHVLQLVR
jgi:hypothetical protein